MDDGQWTIDNACNLTLTTKEAQTPMYKFERLKVYQETVACNHIIERRGYLKEPTSLRELDQLGKTLARSLQSMRKSLLS